MKTVELNEYEVKEITRLLLSEKEHQASMIPQLARQLSRAELADVDARRNCIATITDILKKLEYKAPPKCKICGQEIRKEGCYWMHVHGSWRHPAMPMEDGK